MVCIHLQNERSILIEVDLFIFLPFTGGINLLKNYYKEQEVVEPFPEIGNAKESRFYVDMCLVDECLFRGKFNKADIDHHIQMHLNPNQGIQMTIKDISDLTYTIIRGVGGMGKTHLAKQITYQWAKGEILKEIEYLFLINFRTLNTFSSLPTFLSILTELFGSSITESIDENSPNCCFIFDGADEYGGLNNIIEWDRVIKNQVDEDEIGEIPDIDKILHGILNCTNYIFPGRKIILTGRPASCSILVELYLDTTLMALDVIGFNESVVDQYIELFYGNDYKETVICNKLKESTHLRLMSRIPIYLHIMCTLFHEDPEINFRDTHVEMYVWQLAFLFKNHLKGSNTDSVKTLNIFSNSLAKDYIKMLAKLVYEMHTKKKFTFTEEELPEMKDFEYDKGTMIMKVKSDVKRTTYQFFHLTMAEFLSAVHVLIYKEIDVFTFGSDVVTSFWFGLQGGLLDGSKSPQIIRNFVNALGIKQIPESEMLNNFEALKNEVLKRDQSYRSTSWEFFIECYWAFQNKLPRPINTSTFNRLFIGTQMEIKHLIYFLRNEPGVTIEELRINLLPTSRCEMEELVHNLRQCKRIIIRSSIITSLKLFFNEYYKCYVANGVNGNSFCRIHQVYVLDFELNQNIDWMFLIDVDEVHYHCIANDDVTKSIVHLLQNIHRQLGTANKTFKYLGIFISSGYFIEASSAKIENLHISISKDELNKAQNQMVSDMQSHDYKIASIEWTVSISHYYFFSSVSPLSFF